MTTQSLLAGRYRRVRALEGGGAAEVWECVDEVYEHPVAVTVLRLREAGVAATERFHHEARMVGQLTHPGIARVHDVGVDGSTAYLVTELLPGPTLREVLAERGSLPVDEAVGYMDQLLAALGAAHATGVVHRRLSPASLVLGADGRVRVVGFGVAALHESGALSTTGETDLSEDAHYLAPEQATGGEVDGRTDLYAAGRLLTEMLNGRRDAPQVIDLTVARLLAEHPEERPASAEEVRLGLRSGEAFASGVVPGQADHVTEQVHRGPARRWSFLLPVYVAVALTLVIGVMVFLLTRGGMSF